MLWQTGLKKVKKLLKSGDFSGTLREMWNSGNVPHYPRKVRKEKERKFGT